MNVFFALAYAQADRQTEDKHTHAHAYIISVHTDMQLCLHEYKIYTFSHVYAHPRMLSLLSLSRARTRSLHRELDHIWEFMSFSSYNMGTTSSGAVQLVLDLKMDITGRDVLIVEVRMIDMIK
jgi:hypothetical protein